MMKKVYSLIFRNKRQLSMVTGDSQYTSSKGDGDNDVDEEKDDAHLIFVTSITSSAHGENF